MFRKLVFVCLSASSLGEIQHCFRISDMVWKLSGYSVFDIYLMSLLSIKKSNKQCWSDKKSSRIFFLLCFSRCFV